MNERIQELSKQARAYAQQYVNEAVIPYGKTASEFKRIFESKFAELIVRECNSKLDNIGVIDGDSRTIAMKVISEHFGVE